jgi:cystinosin
MLNAVGFACYFAFNGMLYWSPTVQEEYKRKNNGNSSAVMLNDVVFAAHALLLTLVTLAQIFVYWDYPPLDRSGRIFRRIVASTLLVALLVALALAVVVCVSSENVIDWLGYLSVLSEAKVIISLVKYCPQVWMNHRRRSTVGWNIYNVLLDFAGGSLSVAQLVFDAWAQTDWSKVTGDPAKLLLGNVSMFFDVIFMVQHYCLYSSARHQTTALLSEDRDESKA